MSQPNTTPVTPPPGNVPYCGNCGYDLSGSTESSKCPECGKPIVEVLQRPVFDVRKRRSVRWQSQARFMGIPLISVATGRYGTERVGRPVGIIAIGDMPVGVIAIGLIARGVIALGTCSLGFITMGSLAIGVASVGAIAVGFGAAGGVAMGGFAVGGLCGYVFRGFGGLVFKLF